MWWVRRNSRGLRNFLKQPGTLWIFPSLYTICRENGRKYYSVYSFIMSLTSGGKRRVVIQLEIRWSFSVCSACLAYFEQFHNTNFQKNRYIFPFSLEFIRHLLHVWWAYKSYIPSEPLDFKPALLIYSFSANFELFLILCIAIITKNIHFFGDQFLMNRKTKLWEGNRTHLGKAV